MTARRTPTMRRNAFSFGCVFFQAEDGIRDLTVTGVQTCALPIFASVDVNHGLMTWLGVGNVQGLLVRTDKKGSAQETLLLRGGVVGDHLPQLQATVLQIGRASCRERV